MTVSCKEAMVEAQALDRTVMPANGASAATIESLRARLLSERAASKEARQQAHSIAQKVSELQTRLDAEIEYRKNAEVAMNEVLKVLQAKGLAMEGVVIDAYLLSKTSVSGKVAPIRGSKDGESDHSSGEEGSRADAQDESHGSSANSQGSVDDAILSEDSVFEHREGQTSEDSFSDKTQINSGANSGSDSAEGEKEVVNKGEDGSSCELALFSDPLEAHHNVSLWSTNGGEERGIETSSKLLNDTVKCAKEEVNSQSNKDEGVIGQSSELPCDAMKYVEGEVINTQSSGEASDSVKYVKEEVNTQSSGEAGPSSAVDSPCPPEADQVSAHEKEGTMDNLRAGSQQVDDHGHGAPYLSNVETAHIVSMPETETFPRPRPQDVHPYLFSNGYAYGMPHMYAEKVHNVSLAEAPCSKGPLNFFNTAYQNREHLTSKVAEHDRYPQVPISDNVLSLVDDKNGKLASILTALQLAKQQLKDEEEPSLYMGEKFEPPSPIPYPGFYEGVPYQPPYRPWKPEPYNAAPIIHFPMSPTSDHEVSPFERHDGFRRSSSTSAHYMAGYDPYLQPKGELHLGNGITLYTD